MNYGTAWTRAGTFDLNLTNSVILARQNTYYGLVAGAIYSDSIAIDHTLIQGTTDYILVENYDGGGQDVTYAQALAGVAGIAITNTRFVDDAMLDPATYVPLPGSPAVGQSIPVENAPDYTGQIWPVRQTAGALESPYAGQGQVPEVSEPAVTNEPVLSIDEINSPADPLPDLAEGLARRSLTILPFAMD